MLKNKILRSLIIILGFLLYKYQKYFYAYAIFGKEKWNDMYEMISFSIVLFTGIILALVVNYAINKKISFAEFGLNQGFLKGLSWGFVFTLPMFIGLPILVDFKLNFSFEIVYKAMFLAGFGEEFIFRAFLFGLLFYYAGWGFLPAGIFTGLFFGAGHLYQADSFSSALGIFLFTTGASLGFAWFYYAWKSLWMVIFLHGFMDLAWDMCANDQITNNVLGSPWVNVFRFSTLIFAIAYSVFMAKKTGTYDLKSKLWVNKSAFA
ncbi:MAG: CPBP family intramembrane glutamic endopeptidase [Bacteroidota bacterium]